MNHKQYLIRYGFSAVIVFVILYHAWFFIMGALAVYGLFTILQQKNRWH
jgi:hypothetical protein